MNKEELLQSAKAHFEGNPSAEKYHLTTDGFCFETEQDAINHSHNLKEKDVIKVDRSEVIESASTSDNGVKAKSKAQQKADEKAAKEAEQKAADEAAKKAADEAAKKSAE